MLKINFLFSPIHYNNYIITEHAIFKLPLKLWVMAVGVTVSQKTITKQKRFLYNKFHNYEKSEEILKFNNALKTIKS